MLLTESPLPQSLEVDAPNPDRNGLRVAGLFAGIGGVELGLHRAGHRTEVLCEIDEAAQRVLRTKFPDILLLDDIRTVPKLPSVDLIAAGFPCQDLSQAGRTAGINGSRSSLVREVFRLLDQANPRWLLLENVPFMLHLERGQAMHYLTSALSERGYKWAYRVVETRAFGLPQRRRRVLLLASRTHDPRCVLLVDDAGDPSPEDPFADNKELAPLNGHACGFYWTEGLRGLGWAVDAIPTLKGGSSVGIPSAPAIIMPTGDIVTPDIRDAERLQGFRSDWTRSATDSPKKRNGPRWKLVGNAVSVPVAKWVGRKLLRPGTYNDSNDRVHDPGTPWPTAAWSLGGRTYVADVTMWPRRDKPHQLVHFLKYPPTPLSVRATSGFLARARSSRLQFPDGFLDAVALHLSKQQARQQHDE